MSSEQQKTFVSAIAAVACVALLVLLLWAILAPRRHAATLVHIVDAVTGAPVEATATASPEDRENVHGSSDPQPMHVLMWFGSHTVSVTFAADGYAPRTVELDVGEVTVKLEPIEATPE